MRDLSDELKFSVEQAIETGEPLSLCGGGSKQFYGREAQGTVLNVCGHSGIVSYEPTELVLTARCGTRLSTIESILAEKKKMLGFDPPHFSERATLGGAVASGLSGPRRPFAGSVRDFVLGCQLINGRAEILSFGGQVMKNVAGYDVSRLMAGAMGTLGLVLQVSMKVLPCAESDRTLTLQMGEAEALEAMNRWAAMPLPLAGQIWDGESVFVRLCGGSGTVASAAKRIGGDSVAEGARFWRSIGEQSLDFFNTTKNLWRISLAPVTPRLQLCGQWFYDWSGSQRWLISDEPAEVVFEQAGSVGGHACLFRSSEKKGQVFQPMSPGLASLNRKIKQVFDPEGIFNPFRMYPEW